MKKLISAIAVSVTALVALAQYSINWSTIDGGGATTSSGGTFTLSGTIGQPDANEMNGGIYSVQGGFWVPQVVQVGGAPWLSIMPEGGTNVVISWSPADPGWVLQETLNLQTNWLDSASGSTNPISIPATEAAMFYRLRK